MVKLSVTCAVILRDGKLFAACRGQGKNLAGYWEFPGGKVESGETLLECIKREMLEELNMLINPIKVLPHTFHDYENFSIDLYPVVCEVENEKFELREHTDAGWFTRQQIEQLKWAPADLPIVMQLINGEIEHGILVG
jgi:8-oxo-dGTP diphosphatase